MMVLPLQPVMEIRVSGLWLSMGWFWGPPTCVCSVPGELGPIPGATRGIIGDFPVGEARSLAGVGRVRGSQGDVVCRGSSTGSVVLLLPS